MRWSVAPLNHALFTVAALAGAGVLHAQGLTSAAIEGVVLDSTRRPVPAAVVEVRNTTTGERWSPRLTAEGRFVLEHVSSGGPYQVSARAIGFRPVTVDSITLSDGQRFRVEVILTPAAVDLSELHVSAQADPRMGPGRAGPERVLTGQEIARVPNTQRNLINLVTPTPSALRFEFNGWTDQLSAYQADGGQASDLYSGGQTGGLFPAPVPFEAIAEFRTLAAPYDVRFGQVSSGLFSVSTIRGSNTWTGSVYGVYQDRNLVAPDSLIQPFTTWSSGAVVSGPIIRDRLHLALVADYTHFTVVDPGPLVTDTTNNADLLGTGVRLGSAERFRQILHDTWGLDAGTLGASNTERPRLDLWAKLSLQLGRGGVLDLSQRIGDASESGTANRNPALPYATGSTTREDLRDVLETRGAWRVQPGGRWSNELVAAFRKQHDRCRPAGDFSLIYAKADLNGLLAGSDSLCGTTDVRQTGVELSEHASVPVGRHQLTAGLHAEWFSVTDPILIGSQGTWSFASLDALEAGNASQYERTLPGPAAPPGAATAFSVRSVGLYVQDRIQLGRAEISVGLRGDRPWLPDQGRTNSDVLTVFGLETGRPPDARMLWSPRVGLSWDVTGRGSTWVRGGSGVFEGRPPYRWFTGIYQGSGGEQSQLFCSGADVPAFDPTSPPDHCGSGSTPVQRISAYSPGLRFPQTVQSNLGLDQRLPGDLVLSADVTVGYGLSQFRYRDVNLAGPVGVATGEAGRILYGSFAGSRGVPARVDPAYNQVVYVDRGSGDHTLTATLGVQRPLRSGWGFEAHYRWNRAEDHQSLVSFDPLLNLGGTPLVGPAEDRGLAPSLWDARHKVMAQVTVALPLQSSFSLLYVGNTGPPFSYVVQGDANADGMKANDLAYVPRDVRPGGDIELVRRPGTAAPPVEADYLSLDSLIVANPCLARHRGNLAPRNECVNPWQQFTNARLLIGVPTKGRQLVELGVDIYNVLNLLNPSWGINSRVTGTPTLPLLTLVGWNASSGRGLYQLNNRGTSGPKIVSSSSRWRLQFTLRYRF